MSEFQFLKLNIKNHIATVTLNNPKKANSLNQVMWEEIRKLFLELNENSSVRVCIIKSSGKHFSSGIDVNYLVRIMEETKSFSDDEEKRSQYLYEYLGTMQEAFNAISDCKKPVIAAIHGLCLGGAIDLAAACDIRYSLYRSYFSILETKLGIVADMGTLQRLPRIIGDGVHKELALTSKVFSGHRAKVIGFVNKCFLTKKGMYKKALLLAKEIADLPPYAVQGTKQTINYSRDHSVQEGLDYVIKLNAVLLNTPEMETKLSNLVKNL